jgi:hypothetical protein
MMARVVRPGHVGVDAVTGSPKPSAPRTSSSPPPRLGYLQRELEELKHALLVVGGLENEDLALPPDGVGM